MMDLWSVIFQLLYLQFPLQSLTSPSTTCKFFFTPNIYRYNSIVVVSVYAYGGSIPVGLLEQQLQPKLNKQPPKKDRDSPRLAELNQNAFIISTVYCVVRREVSCNCIWWQSFLKYTVNCVSVCVCVCVGGGGVVLSIGS